MGLKYYMKQFYNLSAIRKPDEAFIIINNKDDSIKSIIKILEKKNIKYIMMKNLYFHI